MNYNSKVFLIALYILLGCKENDFNKQIEISKSSIKVNCGLENAENKIFQLEEVVSNNKLIDSISNHKNGISLMSDSLEIDKITYYEIKTGYNSEIRYETYYIFYIEKGNCNNIKIFEPIEGNIIKLSEWRINNKKKETPILSEKTLSKSDFSNTNTNFPISNKKVIPTPHESYGYKYCTAFTNELMPNLTDIGKKWLQQVNLDLQTYMEQGVVDLYYISTYNTAYNLKNGLITIDKKKKATRKSVIEINKFYNNIEINNSKFQSFAFASHFDAYNPKAMSKLPANDLVRIIFTSDMKEWMGTETWEQAFIMAKNMNY